MVGTMVGAAALEVVYGVPGDESPRCFYLLLYLSVSLGILVRRRMHADMLSWSVDLSSCDGMWFYLGAM